METFKMQNEFNGHLKGINSDKIKEFEQQQAVPQK